MNHSYFKDHGISISRYSTFLCNPIRFLYLNFTKNFWITRITFIQKYRVRMIKKFYHSYSNIFSFTHILINNILQSVLHCLKETFSRSRTAFFCSGGRVWTRDTRLATMDRMRQKTSPQIFQLISEIG